MANITLKFEIDEEVFLDAQEWFEDKLQDDLDSIARTRKQIGAAVMSEEERKEGFAVLDRFIGAPMRNAKQLWILLERASVGTSTTRGHVR